MYRRGLVFGALLISGSVVAAPPAPERSEFQQMWDAILGGSNMGPGDGWFKPAQTRYTWERFQTRFDLNKDGRVPADEFTGPPGLFTVLDRDGSGAITADDFDWSDNSAYSRQLGIAQQLLRQGDTNGNKKLSKEEWSALFERAAKGHDSLDAEALRRLLFPPPPPQSKGAGGMPSKAVLLIGLLKGEVGSASEGPKLEALAPDFTLSSPDGKMAITMSENRGKKPVVLIFGSFT